MISEDQIITDIKRKMKLLLLQKSFDNITVKIVIHILTSFHTFSWCYAHSSTEVATFHLAEI